MSNLNDNSDDLLNLGFRSSNDDDDDDNASDNNANASATVANAIALARGANAREANSNIVNHDDESEDESYPNEADIEDPPPLSLKEYIEDDTNVQPEKRMTYIIMLAHQNIENFDPQNNTPYSSFVNRAGYKTIFRFTKKMIIQELKRRDPARKCNRSSNNTAQLFDMLIPLDDELDKQYVVKKIGEHRCHFTNLLCEEAAEAEGGVHVSRMSPADRMRFNLVLDFDPVFEAFMRMQNCLTRTEIDAGQSGAGTEFWELAIPRLNEDDWVPESQAVPSLHSEFALRRNWPRRGYEWTVEKGKKYLNDVRRDLTETIRRYEISGNGANQAVQDDDNGHDNINWGRFDAERARRVAEERIAAGNLNPDATIDGDDRSSFLRHLPVDFLYTWFTLDRLNVIRFTCAQLSQDQSASSHSTPTPTSGTRNSRSNEHREQAVRTQREMVASVRNIGVSISDMSKSNADMGRAAKIRRIDELRSERYRVALSRAAASNNAEEEVHETYITELSVQIDQASREVYGNAAFPAPSNSVPAPNNSSNGPAAAAANN